MITIHHLSIRIRLEDIIKDITYEQKVLENLRRCQRIVGEQFKVIFWNNSLSEKACKKFVERNEKLLFEINTKITPDSSVNVWFLIDKYELDKSKYRYKFTGDILNGIVTYLNIFNVRKQREESYESGNGWKP